MLLFVMLLSQMTNSGCSNPGQEPTEFREPTHFSQPTEATSAPTVPTETALPTDPTEPSEPETLPTEQPTEQPTREPTQPVLELPLLLDDGRLELRSIFPYSGPDPDAGFAMVQDAASVELANISGTYLEAATLDLELADGTALHFEAEELPPETSAMICSLGGIPWQEDAACLRAGVSARYIEAPSDAYSLQAQGLTVTVTNRSDDSGKKFAVLCRCDLGGLFFGGKAIAYPQQPLAPGESRSFEAPECFMGAAVPVRTK